MPCGVVGLAKGLATAARRPAKGLWDSFSEIPCGNREPKHLQSDVLSIISSSPLAISALAFFLSKLDCIFEEGMMAVCTETKVRW